MPLDPALHRLIEDKLAHTQARQWEMPIADVRKGFRDFWTPAITGQPPAPERIDELTIGGPAGGIRARVYASQGDRRDPLLLFFHGGGYVKGGIDESDAFCRRLAIATRHAVLSVDYRLAPEHAFPAAVDDALAAVAWASSHADELGARPGPLVVSGESAGGNLAAVLAILARDEGHPPIALQLLIYPCTAPEPETPSHHKFAEGYVLSRNSIVWFYKHYLRNQRDSNDFRFAPLQTDDLSKLPPALVLVAGYDPLRDEGIEYAKRLIEAGNRVTLANYEGVTHGFYLMGGAVDAARRAVAQSAVALREVFAQRQ